LFWLKLREVGEIVLPALGAFWRWVLGEGLVCQVKLPGIFFWRAERTNDQR